MQADRPILACDVDGVLSLFGFDEPLVQRPGLSYHLIDGVPHCISDRAGQELIRLSEVFELIWATGWEQRANDHLPLILGLPDELPPSAPGPLSWSRPSRMSASLRHTRTRFWPGFATVTLCDEGSAAATREV